MSWRDAAARAVLTVRGYQGAGARFQLIRGRGWGMAGARFWLLAAPVITAPAGNLTTQSTTVQWTAINQSLYRVRMLQGPGFTTVLFDTGQVASQGVRSVLVTGAPTGFTVRLELTVWDQGANNTGGTNAATVSIDRTVTYAGPAAPTAVATTPAGPPRVRLAITNPAGGAAVTSNAVYRSDDAGATYALIASGLAANAVYDDNVVGAGKTYQYRVRAYGAGDTFSESAVI